MNQNPSDSLKEQGAPEVPAPEKPTASLPQICRIWRKYYYVTLIASLLGAAIQMVLLLTAYDPELGVYQSGSVVATLFSIFALIVTLGLLSMPLVLSRIGEAENLKELPPDDSPLIFSNTLCGFILIAILILQLLAGVEPGMSPLSGYFWVAVLILTIPTALHFLLPALPKKAPEGLTKLLAFCPVLWCCCYLLSVFFNNSTAISSPVRILTELGMISSTLYFLCELRVKVGKPTSVGLFTCVNIAIFFSSLCAIPQISVAFINQWVLKTDILYSAVQLCFLTYFIARANTLAKKEL